MADQKLRIVALISIKQESREQLLPVFKTLIEETRKEEGNISYVLTNDVKDQNSFVFVEEWKSQEAINQHMASAHFVAFQGQIKDHLAAVPQVKILSEHF
ncbi:antibiotic biosynthesis monooxygenase family protein (macronuclear) [Tetrahymena thermophila SB210]|uniref:Antibiotic biosynthesis monooxygenase family protein n=1 Tax=Tetrahymena thermophila (strain SB210) TaxID=312017 RepID=W7X4X6_TETTS|nr:antibiotic biosynthesis monooxygenase family protein [Tetrahymena thermophila SB210]EWS74390.1 antibiotic biosynthesis monooxygenase family protein [Tetrahymena thermophila SB210]|eukprot:XP_012653067.1 antibiotic biosynthesis monooxygenase family protein [Tetrahymena thermophila SB210]